MTARVKGQESSRVKLIIEYDGTEFCGWQLQKNAITIQGEIEKALQVLFNSHIGIIGSGRTDTGVHATGQVAHFNLPAGKEMFPLWKLKKSLNGLIPDGIAVKQVTACPSSFHSRYDAKERCYRYYITTEPTALYKKFRWYIAQPLNITLMQKAANQLQKMNDFESFCKKGSSNTTYSCHIFSATWQKKGVDWVFEIKANRFLYGMVRSVVGTLVALGQGKIDFNTFLKVKDNPKIPATRFAAPASGLFLEKITY